MVAVNRPNDPTTPRPKFHGPRGKGFEGLGSQMQRWSVEACGLRGGLVRSVYVKYVCKKHVLSSSYGVKNEVGGIRLRPQIVEPKKQKRTL